MDFDDCPCSGKTLARLVQPAVMIVLSAGPMHGYRIIQELEALRMFHGQRPDPTGVYRLLKTMETRELVTSEWDLTDAGPARRQYTLTAEGHRCLSRWRETLSEYLRALEELLAATSSHALD
jgi:DNA-binding PadR family transcriptional regulator